MKKLTDDIKNICNACGVNPETKRQILQTIAQHIHVLAIRTSMTNEELKFKTPEKRNQAHQAHSTVTG